MTMCDGKNMTGKCTTYYDVELSVPFTALSLEVKAGKFKVCSGRKMYLKCEMITYPLKVDDVTDLNTRQLSFSPLSLESDSELDLLLSCNAQLGRAAHPIMLLATTSILAKSAKCTTGPL